MAGLTVTEKEHWKDRLSRRIDRRIDAIAAEEPQFLDSVKAQARQIAIASFGLADTYRELVAVQQEKSRIVDREEELARQLLIVIRGTDPSRGSAAYCVESYLNEAIKTRVEVEQESLLLKSQLGRRIVELRREKDNLLDTVWLATSSQQIKDLWTKVGELLQDEPTRLEREAIALPSIAE